MAKIKTAKKSKKETTATKSATAKASSISPLNDSSAQLEESDEEDQDEPTISESKTGGRQNVQHKKRENGMSASKLAEEAALTDLLFGGGGGGIPGDDASSDGSDDEGNGGNSGRGVIGDDFDGVNDIDDFYERKKRKEFDRSGGNGGDEMKNVWDGDIFAIDRSGVDVPSDDGEEEEKRANQLVDTQAEDDEDEDEVEDDSSEEDEGVQGKASMKGAAWQDDDDGDDDDGNNSKTGNARKGISLVEGSDRIKKLRRYRDEINPISFSEYELRLRERFVNTASVAARTDWADVPKPEEDDSDDGGSEAHKRKKMKGYASSSEDDEDDDEYDAAASRILQSNASLFANSSSQLPLPPTLLNVVRQRDANIADPNRSAVNAVQFHPSSEAEDNPLLMTAGMDKMLRFFKVDGEENHKIHGIHCEFHGFENCWCNVLSFDAIFVGN